MVGERTKEPTISFHDRGRDGKWSFIYLKYNYIYNWGETLECFAASLIERKTDSTWLKETKPSDPGYWRTSIFSCVIRHLRPSRWIGKHTSEDHSRQLSSSICWTTNWFKENKSTNSFVKAYGSPHWFQQLSFLSYDRPSFQMSS